MSPKKGKIKMWYDVTIISVKGEQKTVLVSAANDDMAKMKAVNSQEGGSFNWSVVSFKKRK